MPAVAARTTWLGRAARLLGLGFVLDRQAASAATRLRRITWRFLLPATTGTGFASLLVYGENADVLAALADASIAQEIRTTPDDRPADCVVALSSGPLDFDAFASQVAPGGTLFVEVDRFRPGARFLSPRRVAADAAARGFMVVGA